MAFDGGTIICSSTTAAVVISNTTRRVLELSVRARFGNVGSVYFGTAGVSDTSGWELRAEDAITLDFSSPSRQGSETMNKFYFDFSSTGDKADWAAVYEK